MNPGWCTPEGQKTGAAKLLSRFEIATRNKYGDPNTVILKATLLDPQDGFREKIVGAAVWSQVSFVDGWSDRPIASPGDEGLEVLDELEQRFARQMYASLWKRRVEIAREKAVAYSELNSDASGNSDANSEGYSDTNALTIFTLDTCAVDPAFQRRGVAAKLVVGGLEEAKRRGGLECTTEASPMGRTVYRKIGFRAEGAEEDLVYEVDEEFAA